MKANRALMNLAVHEQTDHKPIKNTFHLSIPRHELKDLGINKSTNQQGF
jgi:hypothetical protein